MTTAPSLFGQRLSDLILRGPLISLLQELEEAVANPEVDKPLDTSDFSLRLVLAIPLLAHDRDDAFRIAAFCQLLGAGCDPWGRGVDGRPIEWELDALQGDLRTWAVDELMEARRCRYENIQYCMPSEVFDWSEEENRVVAKLREAARIEREREELQAQATVGELEKRRARERNQLKEEEIRKARAAEYVRAQQERNEQAKPVGEPVDTSPPESGHVKSERNLVSEAAQATKVDLKLILKQQPSKADLKDQFTRRSTTLSLCPAARLYPSDGHLRRRQHYLLFVELRRRVGDQCLDPLLHPVIGVFVMRCMHRSSLVGTFENALHNGVQQTNALRHCVVGGTNTLHPGIIETTGCWAITKTVEATDAANPRQDAQATSWPIRALALDGQATEVATTTNRASGLHGQVASRPVTRPTRASDLDEQASRAMMRTIARNAAFGFWQ
ncbi:uncharacterized protein JCM15063_003201 [Sporobolomyces koalae]|uniref:uncharacterized protein n=1 Tax=Sporobolomyces koalae TaxID=500713 RepID=UPI003174BBE9